MDTIDKEILNQIQSGFPITQRPYLEVGKQVGLSETEVLDRIERLKAEGIIRRIGGNFVSKKLGYTSTLCAAKVPDDKVDAFVEIVNAYSGVTHNYQRDHEYNIWFTFIAPDADHIDNALKIMSEKTGVQEILNLPAVKMFKIKVDFEV
jgi:DNA-binding Lrp family transcriptional regulator